MVAPNVISLFSGIGGLDLGFTKEGFKIVFANEKVPEIYKIYQAIHNYRDNESIGIIPIEDLNLSLLPRANIVIGGFPCQGFSMIGSREKNDPRNKLFLFFKQVVKTVEPLFFVAENVLGLKSNYDGYFFDYILDEFNSINNGSYHVFPLILNASDFGVSQARRRLFYFGIHRKVREKDPNWKNLSIEIIFHKLMKYANNGVKIGDKLKQFEGRLFRSGSDYFPFLEFPQPWHFRSRNRKRGYEDVSYTILASMRSISLHPTGIKMKKDNLINDRFTYEWFLSYKYPLLDENRPLSWQEAAAIQGFDREIIDKLETLYSENGFTLKILYKIIGNAVPPPLANSLAKLIKEFIGWEKLTSSCDNLGSLNLGKDIKNDRTKGERLEDLSKSFLIQTFDELFSEIEEFNDDNFLQFLILPFDIEGRFYFNCKGCNNNYDLDKVITKDEYKNLLGDELFKKNGFCSKKCIEWFKLEEIEKTIKSIFGKKVKVSSKKKDYLTLKSIELKSTTKKIPNPKLTVRNEKNKILLEIHLLLCKDNDSHNYISSEINKISNKSILICQCSTKEEVDRKIFKIINYNLQDYSGNQSKFSEKIF